MSEKRASVAAERHAVHQQQSSAGTTWERPPRRRVTSAWSIPPPSSTGGIQIRRSSSHCVACAGWVPNYRIEEPYWSLPSIDVQLESSFLNLPRPDVRGLRLRACRTSAYHLELWIEKSTMDDVLEPLCRRYGVDLVTGIGFQSITSVITMLRQRVSAHSKPTCAFFYISDFDPQPERRCR